MEVWGMSFGALVLNLLLLVVVLSITHLFVALKRNQRRLRAVGPDVVLVSQVSSSHANGTNRDALCEGGPGALGGAVTDIRDVWGGG
jgi:hypothetical protein